MRMPLRATAVLLLTAIVSAATLVMFQSTPRPLTKSGLPVHWGFVSKVYPITGCGEAEHQYV